MSSVSYDYKSILGLSRAVSCLLGFKQSYQVVSSSLYQSQETFCNNFASKAFWVCVYYIWKKESDIDVM